MKFVGNAFSLQMLDLKSGQKIEVRPISQAEAADFAKSAQSCVGHADTAAVMSSQLGMTIACERTNVTLATSDQLLVGQFTGGRLPEGAKELPAEINLCWVLVTVETVKLINPSGLRVEITTYSFGSGHSEYGHETKTVDFSSLKSDLREELRKHPEMNCWSNYSAHEEGGTGTRYKVLS